MKNITLSEVQEALEKWSKKSDVVLFFRNKIDLVVGIAEGGAFPAKLVAQKFGCELEIIKLNYRDKDNNPRHPEPVILSKISIPKGVRNILLVDDVSVTGKTLNTAKKAIGKKIYTMVFKGMADYVLFPNITECVNWPWKA